MRILEKSKCQTEMVFLPDPRPDVKKYTGLPCMKNCTFLQKLLVKLEK